MDAMNRLLADLGAMRMTEDEMRRTDGGLIIVVCAKVDKASPILMTAEHLLLGSAEYQPTRSR